MDWELVRKYRTATSEIYIMILDGEEVGTVNIHMGKELYITITTILELHEENKDELIQFIRKSVLDSVAVELDDGLGVEIQVYSKGEFSEQLFTWEDFFSDTIDDADLDVGYLGEEDDFEDNDK